MEHIPNNYLII